MNCVNCGAPPRAGDQECRYCQSAFDKLVPEVDHDWFHRTLKGFRDDYYRYIAIGEFGGKLTAGQMIQILKLFRDDYYRFLSAQRLLPHTLTPALAGEASSQFKDDYYRMLFVQELSREPKSAIHATEKNTAHAPDRIPSSLPYVIGSGICFALALALFFGECQPKHDEDITLVGVGYGQNREP